MSKGKHAELGAENKAPNGYVYIKTTTGWRLKHHLIAEKELGRTIDSKKERVFFKDNNRGNFDPSNIGVAPKNTAARNTFSRRSFRIEELMEQFVEDAPDKKEALDQLRDSLNNVRSLHNFGSL